MKSPKVKAWIDEALDRLGEQLEQGQSSQLQSYLKFLGRFHRYSAGNAILIGLQRPDASRVAGFKTWQSLGRKVNRGEKGIQIMAPIRYRQETVDDAKEDPLLLGFKTAYVFDVAQTSGNDLPRPVSIGGNPLDMLQRLETWIKHQDIVLEYKQNLQGAQGYSVGGRIVIRSDLAPAQKFGTLVHEVAHELLHQNQEQQHSKTVQESEAEAVTFVVAESIGLDASSSCSDYILSHRGDRKVLLASLERIRTTARTILDGLQDGVDQIAVDPMA